MKLDKYRPFLITAGKVLIALLLIAVVVVIIQVTQSCFNVGLAANDTILLFVGLLATFVVLNNLEQTNRIRQELFNELSEYKLLTDDRLRELEMICNNNAVMIVADKLINSNYEPVEIELGEIVVNGDERTISYRKFLITGCNANLRNRSVFLKYSDPELGDGCRLTRYDCLKYNGYTIMQLQRLSDYILSYYDVKKVERERLFRQDG